ncbi:MAG TPA: NAD-glutamate dehydrogenase domain-containing protein [Candidatus Deferrimicrobiaceae bacterium]|nr:NAD-glutamate dehydrogenase domain-containing protein [Candidatus Deferrimicrobiaceae bacterium]
MTDASRARLDREVLSRVRGLSKEAGENLAWLREHLPPIFFTTQREEPERIAALCLGLRRLSTDRYLFLADRPKEMMAARLSVPGSIYEAVRFLEWRDISYAEMAHSDAPVPGADQELEIQRYEFDRKTEAEIAGGEAAIPGGILAKVRRALREFSPPVPAAEAGKLLRILWLNNERYVRLSPPVRVARILWMLHTGRQQAGIFLDVEKADTEGWKEQGESRVMFAVANPPRREFLGQIVEVFNRLDLGVRRAYKMTLVTDTYPWFLGTFYVRRRDGGLLEKESDLYREVRRELYNTQILATESPIYQEFVVNRMMSGDRASLVSAFIGFAHTNLAHNQPHTYTREDVIRAFQTHPGMSLLLARLFETRFDPEVPDREARYRAVLEETDRAIETHNTGHKQIDDFRRSVFRCARIFVDRTLKTNFFVPEKHALAFRLDPAYLADLGPEFTSDLPKERPFRVTFFYGRHGLGYHIGFSDIARGGWRTIIARSRDDFATAANTLFRENYVLAHTQHLKNKDIYEGGSKMVIVLHAPDLLSREQTDWRLYKVQWAFFHAFLDLFVTENGRAKDPRVVDYYGEDEPIELGPDENMHDRMIEEIAEISRRRGYLLGIGVMSSKRVGINHKEYGVTSTGVVTFAGIALRERGIDFRKDPFSVKFTGGTNGDVAGNAMRILLARCPKVAIRLILDGTGALFDPAGANREELSRILLKEDVEAFDPGKLSPGGFLVYRNVRKTEGLRELYKRAERTEAGVTERWITMDEFYQEFDSLPFTVQADLFLPSGGRPETIDGGNWRRYLREDGSPSAPVIVEGANSFITPEARTALQEAGTVILRDASANKCGVISSSYEIIANLLMSEKEFLAHKEDYVNDVLAILERRAADEAELIFRRRRESGGALLFTEISDALSWEINGHYAQLFGFFQDRPGLALTRPFRETILAHLPDRIRKTPRFRRRIAKLPPKYLSAILAAEIATRIVYRGGFERNLEEDLHRYLSGRPAHPESRAVPPRRGSGK